MSLPLPLAKCPNRLGSVPAGASGTPLRLLRPAAPLSSSSSSSSTYALDPSISSMHPDAVRRRQEAEERQWQRQAERERARSLASAGVKWWQDSSPYLLSCPSPDAFLQAVEGSWQGLVVVNFFSEDCYACKTLHPKLNKIAESYKDLARFIKVNSSLPAFQGFVAGLGISGVPWFHLYRDGQLVASMSVSLSPDKLAAFRLELSKHSRRQESSSNGSTQGDPALEPPSS